MKPNKLNAAYFIDYRQSMNILLFRAVILPPRGVFNISRPKILPGKRQRMKVSNRK